MAPLTHEEKYDYILAVLGSCTEFKPDYGQVANVTGMASATKAQQKFRKLIEDTGKYNLISGKVVPTDADVNIAPPTPKTSVPPSSPHKVKANAGKVKAKKATIGASKTSKKRKISEADVDTEADDKED